MKHVTRDAMRAAEETPSLMERLNDHLRVGRLHLINPETVAELRALASQTAEAVADADPALAKDLADGPGTVSGLVHLLGRGRHALASTAPSRSTRPAQGPRWLRRYSQA